MSKKHKKSWNIQSGGQASGQDHAAEYRIIKFDLIKVAVLNAVYLVVILALYYSNRNSGFLDKWFAKLLHF